MNTKLFLTLCLGSMMIGFILAVTVFFSAQLFGMNGIVGSLIFCMLILIPWIIYIVKKLNDDMKMTRNDLDLDGLKI